MNYVIVPSIREDCIKEFISQWQDEFEKNNIELIVIEDNPNKTFNLDIEHHYSWKEIEKDEVFNEELNDWIISRRDSAIRSYGFMLAYRLGAETIFTLDDDCYPVPGENFFNAHLNKLNSSPVWAPTVPGLRTRGLPYKNLGKLKNVVISVGLWTGVPDFDAIQSLGSEPIDNFVPPENCDQILPSEQYFPICGMNMAFKREIAVLSYFALMGKDIGFSRFDDIWFGIILKKICDHLRLLIAVGHPFIRHIRASDPFNNLIKEAHGVKYNETFWERIDNIELKGNTPKECMFEIGTGLMGTEEDNFDDYSVKLGMAIKIWTKFFNEEL